MWWIGIAAAAAATDGDLGFVEALGWLTARDGVRVAPDVVDARLLAACAAGARGACALRDGTPLLDVLEPLCAAGDGASCLGVAWASLPRVDGSPDATRPPDPVRYRQLAEQACAAGIPRGCTEVGWVHRHGIDTYPNPTAARARWTESCRAGEIGACTALGTLDGEQARWLEQGRAGGDPVAALLLADLPGEPAAERLAEACDGGATAGCVALVTRFGVIGERLDRACTLGDPRACSLAVRVEAEAGRIAPAAAAQALAACCPQVPSACEEATFLTQGAPPRVHYPGRLGSEQELGILARYVRSEVNDCNLALLRRDRASPQRNVHATLRVDADGHVRGVYLPDPGDEAHGTCLAEALLGQRVGAPSDGDARAEFAIGTFHGAGVELVGRDVGESEELAWVARDLHRWEAPLDACFLAHDRAEADVELEVSFRARPSGEMDELVVVDTSETPALDRCALDWLATHRLAAPPWFATRLGATITFLEPRPDTTELPPPRPPARPVVPVVWRVLVLVIEASEVEGQPLRFGRGAVEVVESAHRRLAEHFAEASWGAVRLETEVRAVRTSIGRLTALRETDLPTRWELPVDALPAQIDTLVTPGAYDAVVLWVPVPRQKEGHVGSTWRSAAVDGALLSIVPASPVEMAGSDAVWERALDGWWAHVGVRAQRLLGIDEGVVPAEGPAAVASAVAAVHPDLWADLLSAGVRVADPAADLAFAGRPVTLGVLSPEALNDGVVEFGSFPNVPRGDPDAEAVWFGIEWRAPVRASRVVAHLGSLPDPTRPSFRRPVLEAILASDRSGWVPLAATVTAEDARVTFTFETSDLVAVRVRMEDDARVPVCRELEVY